MTKNSPDMNSIEILWAILESKLHKYNLKTKVEFKTLIYKAWFNDITNTVVENIFKSMKIRTLSAVKAKVGETDNQNKCFQ